MTLFAGEFGHFRGHVHVGNARFRSLQVFRLDFDVGHGVFQTVLQGAQAGADLVFLTMASSNWPNAS
jgi:hypothetical protein